MTMTSASSSYFEKIAKQWDDIRGGYFTEAVRETAIKKAYLRPEMTVADVGSGTGFVAAGLAPIVQKIFVLDGSPAMLEVARKNLSQFTNIEFHLSDGQSLALPDEAVDTAFANMYLHHCPDPLAAIREMVRILKPGGRLVITDADTHTHTWMKEEMADLWLGFDRKQIRDWFSEAGLVNVIVDCTGQNCCAESENPDITDESERSAQISIFVATGTKCLPMREQVQTHYASLALGGCGCGSSSSDFTAQEEEDSGSTSCCCLDTSAPQDPSSIQFYTAEELLTVPSEASSFSLGCGNPIAMSKLKPGDVVLDIGSGGGLDSFLAAGKVGPQGWVIGVDMTPAMLARARSAAQKAGLLNVEFRKGQAEALPVEDKSVDVIISNCVINLCEDKGLVFRDAFRVLKPGGRLDVSDVVTSGSYPLEDRRNSEDWSECVSGALPEQEYLDLIAQAGFEQISIQRSMTYGEVSGVKVYSAIVSAIKPDGA